MEYWKSGMKESWNHGIMDLKRSRNFQLKTGIKSVYDDAITDLRSSD